MRSRKRGQSPEASHAEGKKKTKSTSDEIDQENSHATQVSKTSTKKQTNRSSAEKKKRSKKATQSTGAAQCDTNPEFEETRAHVAPLRYGPADPPLQSVSRHDIVLAPYNGLIHYAKILHVRDQDCIAVLFVNKNADKPAIDIVRLLDLKKPYDLALPENDSSFDVQPNRAKLRNRKNGSISRNTHVLARRPDHDHFEAGFVSKLSSRGKTETYITSFKRDGLISELLRRDLVLLFSGDPMNLDSKAADAWPVPSFPKYAKDAKVDALNHALSSKRKTDMERIADLQDFRSEDFMYTPVAEEPVPVDAGAHSDFWIKFEHFAAIRDDGTPPIVHVRDDTAAGEITGLICVDSKDDEVVFTFSQDPAGAEHSTAFSAADIENVYYHASDGKTPPYLAFTFHGKDSKIFTAPRRKTAQKSLLSAIRCMRSRLLTSRGEAAITGNTAATNADIVADTVSGAQDHAASSEKFQIAPDQNTVISVANSEDVADADTSAYARAVGVGGIDSITTTENVDEDDRVSVSDLPAGALQELDDLVPKDTSEPAPTSAPVVELDEDEPPHGGDPDNAIFISDESSDESA